MAEYKLIKDEIKQIELRYLKKYLEQIPPGRIEETADLEKLLAKCWHDLDGDDGGMQGYKIFGRLENVFWDPPEISFTIERHGATVMGSTRSEIQSWTVNVDLGTANFCVPGYRQVYERQTALNVVPIAKEIAQLILEHKNDDRLKWYDDDQVRVLIGKILPERSAFKQTLQGRRRRFRKNLTKRLITEGWNEIRPNYYLPSAK
jgi:hypothetical protein